MAEKHYIQFICKIFPDLKMIGQLHNDDVTHTLYVSDQNFLRVLVEDFGDLRQDRIFVTVISQLKSETIHLSLRGEWWDSLRSLLYEHYEFYKHTTPTRALGKLGFFVLGD